MRTQLRKKNPENHKGTTMWVQTETEHTQKYTCCGAVTVETEPHKWEDGICTECGYGCAHTGGKADCTTLAVCEICGESYGVLDPENHTGEKEWTRTEKEHTQKYTCCGAVTVATEAHEWENGICTECGYTCAHTGGTADCTKVAVCEICGESYGDIDPANHSALRKIEAKAATRETEGNSEYWYCEGCKKYFSDEKGAHEITLASTVIPRLTAEPETPTKPTEPTKPAKPAKPPKTAQTTPQTGDELPISLFGILFAGSAAVLGSMVYKKKKRA